MELPMRSLILMSLVFGLYIPLSAQAAGEVSLSPAIENITIESLEQPAQYTVYITSNLDQPQQVVFEALPVSSVDQLGKPILDLSSTSRERLSQQVTLDPQQSLLLPQETAGISVTIHGNFLPPGGTYALITATLKENEDNRNQPRASVVPVIASFLAIRNPYGENRQLSLGGITWPRIPVTLTLRDEVEVNLENQGNVHVEPHGLVQLTDTFNRLIARGQLNENSHLIMPSQTKVLGVSMQSLHSGLPLALYSLTTTGSDELGQNSFERTKRFLYISPWIIGLLMGIGLFIWLRYRFPDFRPFKRRKLHKSKDLSSRTSVSDVIEILQPKQQR